MSMLWALLRSSLHMLWMLVTVVPFTLVILLMALFRVSKTHRYPVARAWLTHCVNSARWICGVRYEVIGHENLAPLENRPVVVLVKHQSTYETFLMPGIMPKPLAYVFKKELLKIPFFGWSIGSLDMVHIDRASSIRAFAKVISRGKELLTKGHWVIMFPEGTRVARGEVGDYKPGGTRLAIAAGAWVLPVAVSSARCWPKHSFIKTPGLVSVSIGPAIDSEGRQAPELMQEVQQWIETEMRRIDAPAYASDAGHGQR
jgi:1-acyl-sn-glycerol-3-phosphate acyltransferase